MQKPQQRKYHSSCNHSVHRGTAHGKQEVKVCKRKTPHLFWCGVFLPPYGDGTKDLTDSRWPQPVSAPLRGSYHLHRGQDRGAYVLAPLRGSHEAWEVLPVHLWVFAPLRGSYLYPKFFKVRCAEFSPPYGDHILNISQPIEKRKSQKVGKYLLYCNAVNLHKKEQMQTLRL